MANRRDYIFTTHLRERFIQRTNKKYNHLQNCREEDCETCHSMMEEIRQDLAENRRTYDAKIANRLDTAEENKSYINNTGFMSWYYEKYGYDKRFEFLVSDELLFVVVYDDGKKIVVTCVPSKTHTVGKNHLGKLKFNKIPRKEDKINQSIS